MKTAIVTIKQATIEDTVLISEISCDTFYETFASANTKEDMDLFLRECFNVEAVRIELSDRDTVYYMAYLNNKLTGYVKIKKALHPNLKSSNCLEIARLYVYETYQNKKIGAALMQYVLDHAVSNGFKVVWLGVWELNPKAIEFYKRWGFEVFGKHIFRLGTDDQNDLLMCKYLE